MNQKLSWTLVAAGGAMFLFQFGDLIAHHSTWSEVLSPAGTGDILRTLGGVLLALFGAIGVRFDVEDRNAVSAATLKSLPPAAVLLVAMLVSSCGVHGAPITPHPTPDQIAQARADAIRIAQATGSGADIAKFALQTADQLEKAGVLPAVQLAAIATAAQQFAKGADVALVALRDVSKDPSLLKTASVLTATLSPLITVLEASSNTVLKAIGASLRLATSFIPAYVGNGGGTHGGDLRVDRRGSGGHQGARGPDFHLAW
jgi:hypothetical protein